MTLTGLAAGGRVSVAGTVATPTVTDDTCRTSRSGRMSPGTTNWGPPATRRPFSVRASRAG